MNTYNFIAIIIWVFYAKGFIRIKTEMKQYIYIFIYLLKQSLCTSRHLCLLTYLGKASVDSINLTQLPRHNSLKAFQSCFRNFYLFFSH